MRNEEFRFTAEHIGSEVLERFSRDIYHPKAIIRELVKNGNDSYWELDQFIDESYTGNIDYNPYQRIVDIVVADQSLIISDYGIGLDRTSIDRLVSIALTDKRKIPGASGFRGIGFWSAYMGGDQIVVESTKLSDSRKYRLTLNTKRMRELQGPNTSIGAIMNNSDCVVLESDVARTDEHYTKIIIHAEMSEGSLFHLVQNPPLLNKIILEACPCGLSEESHNFTEINDFYNDFNIQTCRLQYQGVEILKSIPASVGPLQRKSIHTRIGKQDIVLAQAWYCTNQSNALINSSFAGLRVFRDGVPIGLPNLYGGKDYPDSEVSLSRPDILNWHIGEVHILHEELRPDASGEGLRDSELFRIFREELRKFYSDLIELSFEKSARGSIVKEYDEYLRKLTDIKTVRVKNAELSSTQIEQIEVIAKVVDRDTKKARSKVKSELKKTSRDALVRHTDIKSRRRSVTQLLKNIDTKPKRVESEINSNPAMLHETLKQLPDIDVKSSSAVNAEALPIALAVIDEIRDAIFDVLSDEPSLRDELLRRLDIIAVETQEDWGVK